MDLTTLLSNEHLAQDGIVNWGYVEGSKPISFDYFSNWISKKYHGPLNYLADYRSTIRSDIKLFYPKYSSALVFLFSYTKEKIKWNSYFKRNSSSNQLKMAGFSLGFRGIDYHHEISDKLANISSKVKKIFPNIDICHSLDAQPILERDLAYRAGLGWFGKNSMLINRQEGSFFIIAALLMSQKLNLEKRPISKNHCGKCRLCIDVCPTGAICEDNRMINAKKCISTFTTEIFKKCAPPIGYAKEEMSIFGCDLCQEICPWNTKKIKSIDFKNENYQFSPMENKIAEFFFQKPIKEIIRKLESLSNREFKKTFHKSSLERTGKIGILKNLYPLIK